MALRDAMWAGACTHLLCARMEARSPARLPTPACHPRAADSSRDMHTIRFSSDLGAQMEGVIKEVGGP